MTPSLPLALQEPRATRSWDGPVPGCYPGTVVSAEDPDKEGKVRVRVDQLYGAAVESEKIEDDDLPWARPAFSTTGSKSGAPWAPPLGAGVWVMFWGGDPEYPVWFGGFYGSGDVPDEFVSSYAPDPQTRLIRTTNGHLFEMRWKSGQSYIRVRTADGFQALLDDTNKRAEISTPGQREVVLDELAPGAEFVRIKTPTQAIEMLDAPPGNINVTTPGNINATAGGGIVAVAAGAAAVTALGISLTSTGAAPTSMVGGGTLTSNFAGAATYIFAGALTYTIAGLFALTALGVTITGAAVALVTTGVPILLGTAAALKYRLAHEQVMILLQDMLFVLENHQHPETGATTGTSTLQVTSQAGSPPRAGGLTSVPPGNVSLDVNTMVTNNVRAD